jgi:hypothetical protein
MSEGLASARGAVIAGGGLLLWALVLHSRFPSVSWFLWTVFMSMPFLAFGARVEADGDLRSARRIWTLAAVALVAIFELFTWDGRLILVLPVASPFIAIGVWLGAGPDVRPAMLARLGRR